MPMADGPPPPHVPASLDGSANVGDGRRAENTETASYAQVDATGSDHSPF